MILLSLCYDLVAVSVGCFHSFVSLSVLVFGLVPIHYPFESDSLLAFFLPPKVAIRP